jgi:hypothetical protein
MQKTSITLAMNKCRSVSASFSSTSRPPLKPISFVSATRAPLKPISASVTKNLEHLENLDGFVPGHQHHQHGMSSGGGHGGHGGGGGQAGNYLLNGSKTVNGQRPSGPRKPIDVTVMAQRDARR